MCPSELLPVSEFGHLATFLGVTTLAQVVLDFGVGSLVSRERAADPDNPVVAAAFRFTNVSSLGLIGHAADRDDRGRTLFSDAYWQMLPLAVWAAAERNADTRLSVAFADGDVQINVINLLSRRTAALVIFVVATALGVPPILAFSLSAAWPPSGRPPSPRGGSGAVSSDAREVGFSEVTAPGPTVLGERDRHTGSKSGRRGGRRARGATQAGLYSSGSRLMSPLRILPTSLAMILLPASAKTQKSAHALRSLLRLAVAVVAGMSLLYAAIWLAVPTFVDRALGSAYVDATPVIRIIVAGLPLAAMCSMLNSILQGRGRSKDVAVASSSTTAACLVGIAVVSPFYGAVGAATVLTLSFVIQLGILLCPLRRMLIESRVDQ